MQLVTKHIRLSKTPVVMELLDLGNQESVQQAVV
jgi:hypothetical protein